MLVTARQRGMRKQAQETRNTLGEERRVIAATGKQTGALLTGAVKPNLNQLLFKLKLCVSAPAAIWDEFCAICNCTD